MLEHLPLEAIDASARGIGRATRAAGPRSTRSTTSLRGAGDDDHLARLRRIAEVAWASPTRELERGAGGSRDDPETYFLSAESHNRWRGDARYAEFPMRRCVSIQLCVMAGARSA